MRAVGTRRRSVRARFFFSVEVRGVSRRAARAEGPAHGTATRSIPAAGGSRKAAGRASVSAVRADDRGDGKAARRHDEENVAACHVSESIPELYPERLLVHAGCSAAYCCEVRLSDFPHNLNRSVVPFVRRPTVM